MVINKIISIKSNKLYFGKDFLKVKELLKDSNNISDMGSFISIDYEDCTIFLNELYNLDVYSNLNKVEVKDKIKDIEKDINKIIAGFTFNTETLNVKC